MSDDGRVQDAEQEVVTALSGLSARFHKECKLAFVMWRPGIPECFMVVGDEPLTGAVEAIERSLKEPA